MFGWMTERKRDMAKTLEYKKTLEYHKKNGDKKRYTNLLNGKNILDIKNFEEHLEYIDWSSFIAPWFTPLEYIERHKKEMNWEMNLYNLYKNGVIDDEWLLKKENHFIIKREIKDRYWWKPSDKLVTFFINDMSKEQVQSLGAIPFEAFLKRKNDIDPHFMLADKVGVEKYTTNQLKVLKSILEFREMY